MSLRNPPKVFVRNPSKYNADTHDPELRARLDDALLRRGKIEELQQLLEQVLSPENSALYNQRLEAHTVAILEETNGEISSGELSARVLGKLKEEGAIPGSIRGEVKEKLKAMLLECVEFGSDEEDEAEKPKVSASASVSAASRLQPKPGSRTATKGTGRFLMSSSFSSSRT